MCDWIRNRNETCLDLHTEPADKGHSYRQLARTLGIVMWNLHYRGDKDKKPCKQRQWINRCSFADSCAIFSRQCGNCHLSPCTLQSTTKFAAKVSLSLRIFRAGLGAQSLDYAPWHLLVKHCTSSRIHVQVKTSVSTCMICGQYVPESHDPLSADWTNHNTATSISREFMVIFDLNTQKEHQSDCAYDLRMWKATNCIPSYLQQETQ